MSIFYFEMKYDWEVCFKINAVYMNTFRHIGHAYVHYEDFMFSRVMRKRVAAMEV